jgi:hypothetical protein
MMANQSLGRGCSNRVRKAAAILDECARQGSGEEAEVRIPVNRVVVIRQKGLTCL